MAAKKQTFEQALARMEEIASLLEMGDVPLEDCVGLYKEGMKLSAFCKNKLNQVQKDIQMIRDETQ